MTKHGTASQVTGSYVEFQSAVLRALPRDIDPDVALGWTQNSESLARVLKTALIPNEKSSANNIFHITYDGSCRTSELVALGKYYWSDRQITDKMFPIQKHIPVERAIELIEFDYGITSEDALTEFACRGLERPTYEDALYFGIQYPEEQRKKRPIVFLHEPVFPDKNSHLRVVLVLDKTAVGRRGIYLNWFFNNNKWNSFCTFAAIRKSG